VVREGFDLLNLKKDKLRQKFPNLTEDQLEALHDELTIQTQKGLREDYEAGQQADPSWKEDQSLFENLTDADVLSEFAGGVTGSINPTWLLNPGAGAVSRIGSQGVIAAGEEAAGQSFDINDGLREGYDGGDIALNAAFGTAFQGGAEAISKVAKFIKGEKPAPNDPLEVAPVQTRLSPEAEARYRELLVDPASTAQDIDAFLKAEGLGGVTNIPAVEAWIKAGRPNPRVQYEGVKGGSAKLPQVAYKKYTSQDVQTRVDEVTADWENAPEFEIVERPSKIVDKAIRKTATQNPDAGRVVGLVGRDGKVRIFSENVRSDDELSAVIFHEALGHTGLNNLFRDELDNVLDEFLTNGKGDFANRVDAWVAANPDAYKGAPDQRLRAAEEVLAEMSQKGEITPSMLARIKEWLKRFARKHGMKLRYSDEEIRTILGIAHSTVTKKGQQFAPSGTRFIYIGEKANLTDQQTMQLTLAQQEIQGMTIPEGYDEPGLPGNLEDMRNRLGWFPAPDNKWRYELSDGESQLSSTAFEELTKTETTPDWLTKYSGPKRLSELLHHPALYEAYPELKDLEVRPAPETSDFSGVYDPTTDRIEMSVSIRSQDEFHSILLHEIQHAIQEREGFAKGGNSATALKVTQYEQLRKLADDRIRELRPSLRSYQEILKDFSLPSTTRILRNYVDIVRRIQTKTDAEEALDFATSMEEWVSPSLMNRLDLFEAIARGPDFRDKPTEDVVKVFKTTVEANIQDKAKELRDLSSQDAKTLRKTLMDIEDVKYKAYLNLLGEIEARDVQSRMFYSDEGRAWYEPYASQAVRPSEMTIYDVDRDARTKPQSDDGTRFMRAREDNGGRIGNTNLDYIKTVNDVSDLLDDLRGENPLPEGKTEQQIILESKDLGYTPSKLLKTKDVGNLAARIQASRQVMTDLLDEIENLRTDGNYSAATHVRRAKLYATLVAVHGKVQGDVAEVARALRTMQITSQSKLSADEVVKMLKEQGNDIYANPELLEQLDDQIKNFLRQGKKGAAIKMLKASMEPKASDYIYSLWYNSLLSSPATHVANVVGTGLNFAMDLAEQAGAAVIGQGRRFSSNAADRVSGTEVLARVWGVGAALLDAGTWKRGGDAFVTGQTVGSQFKGSPTNLVMPGVSSYALELPTRSLAAQDETFRNVISLSNIYGLAVRNVRAKGLKPTDKAFWREVRNLVEDPTYDMLNKSADYAKVLQFLDEPSPIGKWLNAGKTRQADDNFLTTLGRGLLRFTVPFVNTPDALIRTAIRRMGPLGLLERETVKGMKSGSKADQDMVKARMVIGTGMMALAASAAFNGVISGAGPADPEKRRAWEATHQANSVKIGDEWVSIAGFEPITTPFIAMATLVERLKSNDMSEKDYAEQAASVVFGLAQAMSESAYTEGVTDLFETLGSGSEAKLSNWVAGMAAAGLVPGAVRQYASNYEDGVAEDEDRAIRATAGDGSLTDRVTGRVLGGYDDDSLPQRHDVYGRPVFRGAPLGWNMASRMYTKPVETDPTIIEIQRLEDGQAGVLLGPPGKSITIDGVKTRLNDEEFYEYQRLSGEWVVNIIRNEMENGEWADMSDEERKDFIKSTKTRQRKYAREELFSEQPDPDEEEDTEE
jgi:hypothetical protein